jgi:hypothetical protein
MTDQEKAARKAERDAKKSAAAPVDAAREERIEAAQEDLFSKMGAGLMCLFVDCLPDSVQPTYADTLIQKANERIVAQSAADGAPVAHYKFLSYGKGPGALDIALQQVLAEMRPAVVFCSSSSEALPTLTRVASMITRSVR